MKRSDCIKAVNDKGLEIPTTVYSSGYASYTTNELADPDSAQLL